MKKNIGKYLLVATLLSSTVYMTSCDNGLEEINQNPNNPEVVPTSTIFNGATRYLMQNTRDGWWSARLTLPWMQYIAQLEYTEEDKYQYRDNQTGNAWNYIYRAMNNFKDIIQRCEDPVNGSQMAQYGNLQNQVAVSRIMLAYSFDELVSSFGDVPYWSYGGKLNPDFQALQVDDFPAPKYVSQEVIYTDLLKELSEAADQLVLNETVFINGDNIYGGDAVAWKKFANSLRLRIANRVKDKLPVAKAHITDAIADGVFTSNADNATHAFGNSVAEGSPFWATHYTGDMRTDFAMNAVFIDFLKGVSTKNYGVDPRLQKFAAPIGLTRDDIYPMKYSEDNTIDKYVGMPYGLPKDRLTKNNNTKNLSFVSGNVMNPMYKEVLMEYAEVEFILSEVNNWDANHYKAGVQASMDKWGVSPSKSSAYIAALPAVNKENVITQKYIALFMQGTEAWNEYRRTGYPNKDVLLMPGETATEITGVPYIFTPLISGNVVVTDLPARVRYPITNPTLNPDNYNAAVSKLNNGDEIDSKLFFAK